MGRFLKANEMVKERLLGKASFFWGFILSMFLGVIPLFYIFSVVYRGQLRGFVSDTLSNLFGLNAADPFIYNGPIFVAAALFCMLISLSPIIVVTVIHVPIKYALYWLFIGLGLVGSAIFLPYLTYLYIFYVILRVDLLYSAYLTIAAASLTCLALLYVVGKKKLLEKI